MPHASFFDDHLALIVQGKRKAVNAQLFQKSEVRRQDQSYFWPAKFTFVHLTFIIINYIIINYY